MPSQSKLSWYLGSGKEGVDREERYKKTAAALGYSGIGEMATDMVDWMLDRAVWKKGEGLIGLKKKA